jgi:hypothetical protein
MKMGSTAETPTVKITLTKTDAGRLNETLIKAREPLQNLIDPVSKAQVDFLDNVIACVQSAIKTAPKDATPSSPPAGTPI